MRRWSILLLAAFVAACASPVSLGNGTLAGVLPGGWHDSSRPDPDQLVRVTDDDVPLPAELVILVAPESVEATGQAWVVVAEETRPAPRTRVGDRWQDNTRDVRVYRTRFADGRVLEAVVDVRFDRARAERFLRSLRPAAR